MTQLASLAGVPVHATPLYSIAGNIVIGVALLRLRIVGTPDSLIIGTYLILTGATRFVEESFRAEPQTLIVGGLHSYQWIAVGSLIVGIVCTTLEREGLGGRDAFAIISTLTARKSLTLIASHEPMDDLNLLTTQPERRAAPTSENEKQK